MQGTDGSFYGTTSGDTQFGGTNQGTVFRITTNGALTSLFFFSGKNGSRPRAPLIQGPDGNFYGTTFEGGSTYNPAAGSSYGTVFKITPDGSLTTLVSFNVTNGFWPAAGLVLGNDGNLYGTTPYGGAGGGGTIFRLVRQPVITSINRSNASETSLTWISFTNGTYQVEYKSTLAATNWTVLAGNVSANGSTASFTDNSGGASERYYRIRLSP